MLEKVTKQDLLRAGAHFGHLSYRWNPRMKDYILSCYKGFHVIDIEATLKHLENVLDVVKSVVTQGKTILFVGTSRCVQPIIEAEVVRCGMPYVSRRWLGGMLTNFSTIRKSILRIVEIDEMQENKLLNKLTKKEKASLLREKKRMEVNLKGISQMTKLPDLLFVVNLRRENIVVQEAKTLHIPIIALADTNTDPEPTDYFIPCNDDSPEAVQLIVSAIVDAVVSGIVEQEVLRDKVIVEQGAQENTDPLPTEEEVPVAKRRLRKRKVK